MRKDKGKLFVWFIAAVMFCIFAMAVMNIDNGFTPKEHTFVKEARIIRAPML